MPRAGSLRLDLLQSLEAMHGQEFRAAAGMAADPATVMKKGRGCPEGMSRLSSVERG